MVSLEDMIELNAYHARQAQLSQAIQMVISLQQTAKIHRLTLTGLKKSLHHTLQSLGRARRAHQRSNDSLMEYYLKRAQRNIDLSMRQVVKELSQRAPSTVMGGIANELQDLQQTLTARPQVML